jgi:hypothetical protein
VRIPAMLTREVAAGCNLNRDKRREIMNQGFFFVDGFVGIKIVMKCPDSLRQEFKFHSVNTNPADVLSGNHKKLSSRDRSSSGTILMKSAKVTIVILIAPSVKP